MAKTQAPRRSCRSAGGRRRRGRDRVAVFVWLARDASPPTMRRLRDGLRRSATRVGGPIVEVDGRRQPVRRSRHRAREDRSAGLSGRRRSRPRRAGRRGSQRAWRPGAGVPIAEVSTRSDLRTATGGVAKRRPVRARRGPPGRGAQQRNSSRPRRGRANGEATATKSAETSSGSSRWSPRTKSRSSSSTRPSPAPMPPGRPPMRPSPTLRRRRPGGRRRATGGPGAGGGRTRAGGTAGGQAPRPSSSRSRRRGPTRPPRASSRPQAAARPGAAQSRAHRRSRRRPPASSAASPSSSGRSCSPASR